ncbi:OmpA family protein [Geomonas sp.]|uniref:OmpA family protein n=1 Tax=Geomonas sp. TaxID=2651584 RepID=UPI002B4A2044|nr:OmpA family protein [Geomonas sp.]HJV35332.1 OmpA family protein [Geomonas sp.]
MLTDFIAQLCLTLAGLGAGRGDVRPQGGRGDGGRIAPRRRAGTRAFRMWAATLWLGAALFGALLAPSPASSSTNGDQIVNIATFHADGIAPVSASVTVTLLTYSQSTITFLKYAPLSNGQLITGASFFDVGQTQYRTGAATDSPFVTLPAPTPLGSSSPVDLAAVPLIKADSYHTGEPLFVEVTDREANLDPGQRDQLQVTLKNETTGCLQVLKLTETGPNTGIFVGYLGTIDGSNGGSTNSYSGSFTVTQDNQISAQYVNALDISNTSTAQVLVDPLGIVFDAATGKPLDGATVTLWDVDANDYAKVYGDDGSTTNTFPATAVNGKPATVVTGSTPKDASGRTYAFGPGQFRFPFVKPGRYQFKVTPPNGYRYPSAASNSALAKLPGGPFVVVDGSRGLTFTIDPGPELRIDLPVDPVFGKLWLQKSAGKSQAAIGDTVPFQITVQNSQTEDSLPVTGLKVVDQLPPGFSYMKGTTRLNGSLNTPLPDPAVSADGRTLTFTLPDLPAKAMATFSYVTMISAGAQLGTATNSAAAGNGAITSNLATATVEVRSDFLSTRSIIMGRVYSGNCSDKGGSEDQGVAGARIYLEDGTFVETDKKGMFHLEGVTPTTHVVQLDLDSLPEGYQATPCEQNSRFAGRAYSQFVELQAGTMWRADFHVSRSSQRAADGQHDEEAYAAAHRAEIEAADAKLKAELAQARRAQSEDGSGEGAESVENTQVVPVKIELKSRLDGKVVVYEVELAGGAEPLSNRKLKITLPAGVAYFAGSSTLDGQHLPDPQQDGQQLTYSLGDSKEEWKKLVSFKVSPQGGDEDDVLETRAQLEFDTASGSGLSTPEVDNALTISKDEGTIQLPEIVLHPHFPSFGAELSEADKKLLDEIAVKLQAKHVTELKVVGHTDNVRIAPRARKIFRDNIELSRARARTVIRYLVDRLHPPPSVVDYSGRGESEPIASNKTEEGRALNRRVEILLKAARSWSNQKLELVKAESGPQQVEIPLTPHKSEQAAAAEVQKEADAKEKAKEEAEGSDQPAVKEQPGILSPPQGSTLIFPINSVRICLPSELTPRLTVDGHLVPADRIGFTLKDAKSGKTIYSYIGVDFGQRGERVALLEGVDPFGVARFSQSVKVIRSGAVATILVKSADGNVADGKTPVRLQLQFLDSAGNAIPAAADLQVLDGTLKPVKSEEQGLLTTNTASSASPLAAAALSANGSGNGQGDALHVNQSGVALFQPVSKSGLYRMVLGINGVKVEAETYVKPAMRDWILVGLAEGTAGYSAISGHMESAQSAGVDDNLYRDGRLAFYTKGTIKGEWLLTASFDSAKKEGATGNGLFQTIDPNTYYTLYGDASQQQYDAASVKKLYLKIEREQFYAMFGDFNTDLTVTELSRYSRRMNGVKTEYHGKNLEVSAFGSENGQAYVKDEIQGNGTSGLYKLSRRNILLNTDKVTLQVRDRFRSEVVISSQELTRFADYSIDYSSGTLLFKEPIYSRDSNFNPIYIVAEYEIADAGTGALTYGGRAGVKLLDQQLRAGVTYLHEGEVTGNGNSVGVDTTLKIGTGTVVRLEAAHSDSTVAVVNTGGTNGANTTSSAGGGSTSGNAYLAEVSQKSAKLDARIYYREIDQGFGLGQQQASEVGTRKYGLDAAYKLSDQLTVSGTANHQYTMATGAEGDRLEGKATYTSGIYSSSLGVRYANDVTSDGASKTSTQLTASTSAALLDKKLILKLDRDQSIAGNNVADYPTRTTLGAEYKLSPKVSFFAAQEFTQGGSTEGNATRAGFKSNPWEGGAVNSSLERDMTENGSRAFALFGLKQTFKLNEHWSVDAGLDRNQTIKASYRLDNNAPPASGNQDFTAVSLGADYKQKLWSWNGRGEYRNSETDNKWGVLSSVLGEPAPGWGWSARLQLFDTTGSGQTTVNGDLRLGLVHRPLASQWILLDRLDLIYDKQTGTTDADNRRIVNNLNANYRPNAKLQLSLQYGAKYVLETCNGAEVSGYTDLIGVEGRYDLTAKWDVGVASSVLHTWATGQLADSVGVSVGYNLMENAWLSLGYNVAGFYDKDFSAANFTAQGPYVRFRFKFDQNSVKEAMKALNQ